MENRTGNPAFELFLSLTNKRGCPILSWKLAVGLSASGKGWDMRSRRCLKFDPHVEVQLNSRNNTKNRGGRRKDDLPSFCFS